MNNPMAQIVNAVKRGMDPLQMAQRMARSDPKLSQAVKMLDGKSPQQLQQIATNMCKEMGTTPEEFARKLGIF